MNIQKAIEIVSKTHPGKLRSHNEDSLAYSTSCGLAVLADGMGGYNAGELASEIAISLISSEVEHRQNSVRLKNRGQNGSGRSPFVRNQKFLTRAIGIG